MSSNDPIIDAGFNGSGRFSKNLIGSRGSVTGIIIAIILIALIVILIMNIFGKSSFIRDKGRRNIPIGPDVDSLEPMSTMPYMENFEDPVKQKLKWFANTFD